MSPFAPPRPFGVWWADCCLMLSTTVVIAAGIVFCLLPVFV